MILVNVYVPSKDCHFSIEVGPDLTVEDFKIMCSVECNVAPQLMTIFLNTNPLTDDHKTLKDYNVKLNDMFIIQEGSSTSSLSNTLTPGTSTNLPGLDFSNIQIPGSSSTRTAPQTSTHHPNFNDPHTLRQWFLSNPRDLALLKERNPALAESIEQGNLTKLATQLREIQANNELAKREHMQMLTADPMDLEVQRKIAEEIERKNIQENMNMAIEEAPESFGQVIMLWINLKVNGHYVKAFVDSGAQMTIMSSKCAEECNIMRLVDKRWAGVAKGVGTQKIVGRIHLAQIQIENVFMQCSFSILENQPMDVLLGLDMLRRHQCVIDLRENMLTIGSTNTKTKFLPESELPSHGRIHDPNTSQETHSEVTDMEDDINKALMESAAEAIKRDEEKTEMAAGSSSTLGGVTPTASTNEGAASPTSFDGKVKQLMEMGFQRPKAEAELQRVNGDLQLAISNLLSGKVQ